MVRSLENILIYYVICGLGLIRIINFSRNIRSNTYSHHKNIFIRVHIGIESRTNDAKSHCNRGNDVIYIRPGLSSTQAILRTQSYEG